MAWVGAWVGGAARRVVGRWVAGCAPSRMPLSHGRSAPCEPAPPHTLTHTPSPAQVLNVVAGDAVDIWLTSKLRLLRQEHTVARAVLAIQSSLWPGARVFGGGV